MRKQTRRRSMPDSLPLALAVPDALRADFALEQCCTAMTEAWSCTDAQLDALGAEHYAFALADAAAGAQVWQSVRRMDMPRARLLDAIEREIRELLDAPAHARRFHALRAAIRDNRPAAVIVAAARRAGEELSQATA